MEYQKVTSAATFSKKLTNSHSFGGNSIYDGVFSSIPAVKVGSLVEEDYGEIFSCSGGSSIPMLQVPELNERKVSVDVNSSRLDYSKIFGGVGEFDFAASHEQLFATKPKKRDTSAEEPRTKAVTGSCPSNFSEENQVFSRGASCQPFDGMKQFKMSYHKTNQGRENGINGITQIAQLNSVPGYSCLINEVTPSQMTEGDKPSSVLKKSYVNTNYSGEITEGKDSRKAVSSLPTGGADKQACGGVKFQKKSNQSGSNSIDMLFEAQENGLRTCSSKVPLPTSQLNNLGRTKGDFERSVSSNFGVSKSHSCEDAAGFCSPPTFDEEVDSNSVAAASAAAVKKAIEEAQAKIRLAKEIMERKKEGLQNHVKLTFKDGSKAKERREGNITNKSNKSNEEARDEFGKADIRNQVFPRPGMLNLMKAGQVTPDLREGGKLYFTKEASGETHGNKNKSTLVHHRKEEMNGSEAEELGESGARVMRSTIVCEWEDKSFVKKTFETPEENGEKLEAVEETHKQEEVKKLNVVKGACELKECANEPKSDQEVNDQGEYGTKSGLQEEADTSKSTVTGLLEEETDSTSKSTVAGLLEEETDSTSKSTVAGLLEEETDSTSKSTVAGLLEEKTDSTSKSTVAGLLEEETDSTSKSTVETDTISKSMVAGLQEETDTSKASRRLEICEKKQRRLWDLRANEPKSEQKVNNQEEYGMKLTVAGLQEEIDTASKVSHRLETCAKKQRRLWDLTANRTKLDCLELWDSDCMKMRIPTEIWLENENKQEVLRLEENDIKSKDVPERGENKEELHEIFYDSENQDILNREDAETSDDFLDGEQSGKILEEDVEVGVKEEIMDAEENGEILREAYQMKEIEKRKKEIHGWLEIEKIQTTIEQRPADNHSGNSLESANGLCKQDKMEILSDTVGIMEGTRACREMETELESDADELEEKEVFEAKTSGLPQVVLEFDKMQKHAKDTTEDCPFEYNGVNVRQKHVEELACESEEKLKEVEEVEDTMKWGKYESASEFSDEERWNDIEEIVEASPIPSIFQEKEETTKTGNEIETNQNTEKYEENHSETPTTEERQAEGTMQKGVEQEEEHVRKIDEAKEKEREREKERIAVERAIREARERAFTEARERAERNAVERANAEARRRAMAEAREKLEKVPAEANVKLSADKSSMEARLKAQRAAVERATAEARERALEKAMSEKAALEARNQAGKFSHASRDNGKRRNVPSNDCQYKGSGPTRSSGDPSSSNLGVTHSTAKSDKVDGESAQRHKANLERHQQTAERAAKALAEKNMRDLLAQKEQAERNRLAETVDADVKRWSSGKQGNLRALLSTLQYVLGPDSGWQPVPLTDLITTTAVKKTYRKATLFVHPDKLQQRGASIQQKYICEKVFDLLKEAWNKFS